MSGLEPSHWSKISGLSKIFKVRLKNWIAFEQFEVAKFTSRRSIMVRIHLLKPLVCDCYSICGVFRLLRLPTFHNIFTINLYVLWPWCHRDHYDCTCEIISEKVCRCKRKWQKTTTNCQRVVCSFFDSNSNFRVVFDETPRGLNQVLQPLLVSQFIKRIKATFDDGVRRVDFVIVYNRLENESSEIKKKRENFLALLNDEGIEWELSEW